MFDRSILRGYRSILHLKFSSIIEVYFYILEVYFDQTSKYTSTGPDWKVHIQVWKRNEYSWLSLSQHPLSRTSLYLKLKSQSLYVSWNLFFSLYLKLSLSRTNFLVPCEFEIERVSCNLCPRASGVPSIYMLPQITSIWHYIFYPSPSQPSLSSMVVWILWFHAMFLFSLILFILAT
jgi:hypothetical protein